MYPSRTPAFSEMGGCIDLMQCDFSDYVVEWVCELEMTMKIRKQIKRLIKNCGIQTRQKCVENLLFD